MSTLPVNPALLAPTISGVTPSGPNPRSVPTSPAPAQGPGSFAATLHTVAGPTFSKHALERLQRRGIDLDPHTLGRLSDGISRAADKGARNSVVFVDGTAFVASVQNNTVITAVPPEHMRSQVFTNIDSAVIA
ncbi:MAG TPA: TIGR02530 family flagellar biosynthesis protein [Solirubrobacteraceae bacterium]|nr:TIGR02530 family flagellar biosynthesis protein [Solirubrobacteraceae bacterium]